MPQSRMLRPSHRALGVELLECRWLLIAEIDVGHHVLAPDLAGQAVPIQVRDHDQITGFNLRAQLGDGSGPADEPTFEGVDVRDSIWQPFDPVILGGPVANGASLLQASIVLRQADQSVSAPGVLGHMLIDTTGFTAGQFELRLARTEIGIDSDLVGDVARVLDGSVSIAGPGDSNLDGRFNSNDLVVVFQAGEYEDNIAGNSTWFEGDWNGDGEFSTQDLVAAFQAGTYEATALAPAHADAVWSQVALAAALEATADDGPANLRDGARGMR